MSQKFEKQDYTVTTARWACPVGELSWPIYCSAVQCPRTRSPPDSNLAVTTHHKRQ